MAELGPFLLDTHVWIWLMNDNRQMLSSKTIDLLEKAGAKARLGVSALSVWEAGILEAKGRIRFPTTCLEWVREALSAPGIRLIPLTPEIAVESGRLPDGFHGDPVDRILVATGRVNQMVLITRDERILTYREKRYVMVHEA